MMKQKANTPILRYLYCFALIFGLTLGMTGAVMAQSTPTYQTVTSWAELQNTINNAPANTLTNIKLEEDVTATSDETALTIASDKIIRLDLNGHTINRGLTTPEENGNVFQISGGDLTLLDTSGTQSGTITGGATYSNNDGGGIFVDSGTLTLEGGTIANNDSGERGGGIFVKSGTFTMSDGSINTNNAGYFGGGIYADANIAMQGSPAITSNTASNMGNNVYLNGESKIQVGTNFSPSPAISVTLQNGKGDITTGANYDSDEAAQAVFTSENTAYEVYKTDNNQAALKEPETPTTYGVQITSNVKNATRKGSEDQKIIPGSSMATVTYTAIDGYHFDPFDDINHNGITVTRVNEKTVTVSGTPTSNTMIEGIPSAVADSSGPTPGGGETAITPTVTFKVVGGSWDNNSANDIPVSLSGTTDNPPTLEAAQIPTAGAKPAEGYKAEGNWSPYAPNAGTVINENTTFTFTYVKDDAQQEGDPEVTKVTPRSITVKVGSDEEAKKPASTMATHGSDPKPAKTPSPSITSNRTKITSSSSAKFLRMDKPQQPNRSKSPSRHQPSVKPKPKSSSATACRTSR